MIEVLEKLRWKAVAIYRQRNKPDLVRSWMFDEIADLHDAIETGDEPIWADLLDFDSFDGVR